MRVMMMGGAGFMGSNWLDRLLTQGDEVRVVDRFHPFSTRAVKKNKDSRGQPDQDRPPARGRLPHRALSLVGEGSHRGDRPAMRKDPDHPEAPRATGGCAPDLRRHKAARAELGRLPRPRAPRRWPGQAVSSYRSSASRITNASARGFPR